MMGTPEINSYFSYAQYVYNLVCFSNKIVWFSGSATGAISIYDIIPRRAYVSLHALNGAD